MPKVKGSDFEVLRRAIAPLDTEEMRQAYREYDFPNSDSVTDLDRRYRWDLLWASTLLTFISRLYDRGINDDHIDTALRNIVPPL